MPQLTPDERQLLTERLTSSSQAFLDAIEGLTAEQWTFKPAPEVWSIAEIADHVVDAERQLFASIARALKSSAPDPVKGEEIKGKFKLIMKAVPDRSRRVKVPNPVQSTGCVGSPAELKPCFLETRQRTLDFVAQSEDALHDHFFPHFVFGDLSCAHWLMMVALHTGRHVQQIDEVKASSGYPASGS